MEGGARACALRVAVRCDARVEAGARGLAAGRARASCVMGLRTFIGHIRSYPVRVKMDKTGLTHNHGANSDTGLSWFIPVHTTKPTKRLAAPDRRACAALDQSALAIHIEFSRVVIGAAGLGRPRRREADRAAAPRYERAEGCAHHHGRVHVSPESRKCISIFLLMIAHHCASVFTLCQ